MNLLYVIFYIIFYQFIDSQLQMSKKNNKTQQKDFPTLGNVQIQRIPCNCVAQKHPLINNCLNCGKVVCASEGQGPCFFCGNRVTKPDTQYVDRNDAGLFPSMDEQELKKISIERSNARKHKNVLVERDTTNGIVQNIYDQQTDYYQLSENQWAKQEDRKFAVERILLEQKHIEDQSTTNRVYFDQQTNQWIKQQFVYDEQKFKKQAQEFIQQSETKEINSKINKTKEFQLADQRLKNNEKTAEVYDAIKKEWIKEKDKSEKKKKNQKQEKRKYKGLDDIIIEQ